MNRLDKILDTVNSLAKVVPGIFKDASGNLSSKRTFKLLGGGGLMTAGLTFLGSSQGFDHMFAAGSLCIVLGVVTALVMKSPDAVKED